VSTRFLNHNEVLLVPSIVVRATLLSQLQHLVHHGHVLSLERELSKSKEVVASVAMLITPTYYCLSTTINS